MTALVAYKFLRPGAVGPFSGHRWPLPGGGDAGAPGAWVHAVGPGPLAVSGCERRHLPLWICEELWAIELAGAVEAREHKLRASRGRLLRRIDPWSATTAKAFAATCAWRAALHASEALAEAGEADAVELFRHGSDLEALWTAGDELCRRLPAEAGIPAGMARDGARRALTAGAADDAYTAAHGAAVAGYIAAMTAWRVGGLPAYTAERAWQGERFAGNLGLAAAAPGNVA